MTFTIRKRRVYERFCKTAWIVRLARLTPQDKANNAAEYGAAPPGYDFLVIGHEGFGRVEAVGPSGSELKPGDYVVATVRRPGRSIYDLIGTNDMTTDDIYYERGINLRHGYLTGKKDNKYPSVPRSDTIRDWKKTVRPKLAEFFELVQKIPSACAGNADPKVQAMIKSASDLKDKVAEIDAALDLPHQIVISTVLQPDFDYKIGIVEKFIGTTTEDGSRDFTVSPTSHTHAFPRADLQQN